MEPLLLNPVASHSDDPLAFQSVSYCCCSVDNSGLILCNSVDCSTPGFPVLHYLPEFAQTHIHGVGDAI